MHGGPTPLWVCWPNSLIPRPSLRETTSGQAGSCRCVVTRSWWSTVRIKTAFTEFLVLLEPPILPNRSVLTPAISCTKFEVRSFHADSPIGKASCCLTDKEIQEENIYPVQSVQNPFSACRQAHGQNIWLYISRYFLGKTSLCFTEQETKNVLGGPTPLWESSFISNLL